MSETETMDAGREMDALVAERVMDWTAWRSPVAPKGGTAPDCWRTKSRRSPTIRISGWNPSVDIARAWQVVERVQALHPGWRFSVLGGDTSFAMAGGHVDREKRARFGWHAEFFGDEDPAKDYGQRHGAAYADTAPLAICRAALLATEARA